MKEGTVYCWRRGNIGFGTKVPNGALPIQRGPLSQLRKVVSVIARQSYPSKRGGKDTCLLVPGIPEADNEVAAMKALNIFTLEIRKRINPAIGAIEKAIGNVDVFPDPIVLPLMQNDLQKALSVAREYSLTLEQLDQAIRHIHCHVPIDRKKHIVRKWGRK